MFDLKFLFLTKISIFDKNFDFWQKFLFWASYNIPNYFVKLEFARVQPSGFDIFLAN